MQDDVQEMLKQGKSAGESPKKGTGEAAPAAQHDDGRKGDQSFAHKMSKIKKTMGLRGEGEPTLDQMTSVLNMQDRTDLRQNEIMKEK